MTTASPSTYLADVVRQMRKTWPENRTVNIACHGHSVPAGYFVTPRVEALRAYPHLLRTGLHARFPHAVLNVIVTAIGGEHAERGAARFEREVLAFRPEVVTIDYALNDRSIGLARARAAWSRMIREGLAAGARIILLTPTADMTQAPGYAGTDAAVLLEHAQQIRDLAQEFEVGLSDSLAAFQHHMTTGNLRDLLSQDNHPSQRGHELAARELLAWFPADIEMA